MCYAIIEVKYISAGEQDQIVRCTDAATLDKKVNELKQLGTVASIQTFTPVVKLKRTVVWESEDEVGVQVQLDDRLLDTKRIEG